jgi:hypothetical protein
MDVVIAVINRRRSFDMKTFTIDAENDITAFATPDLAAASVAAGAQAFGNQQELAELAASWPAGRLIEVWNSLPGVKPVKGFKTGNGAVGKIWNRIQSLGEPEKPEAQKEAKASARSKRPPAKAKTDEKTAPAKKALQSPKKARLKKDAVTREGSKTAQVVAMLQRKGGATLAEITAKMGWQKHTVRGFMAGTMKKAGYSVESFKPEGGERTYRISK